MARYINEDEFIAWVKEHWCADCQNDNGLRCRACWIDDAIDIVEEAPPADVVPKSEVEKIIEETFKRVRENFVISPLCKSALPDLEAELKKKYTEGL